MIAAGGLRWILTVSFAVLAVYGLCRAARGTGGAGGVAGRVAHALHAVMAVAMGVMVWPGGMDLPALPQVVFFAAAALWFAVAAWVWAGGTSRGRAVLGSLPHVLVTAAMAWMLAAMDSAMAGGGTGDAGGMPGMDMTGTAAVATMTFTGRGQQLTAGLVALVMLGLALWWLARAFDTGRHPHGAGQDGAGTAGEHGAYDLACHGAMALGMAVMCALLV